MSVIKWETPLSYNANLMYKIFLNTNNNTYYYYFCIISQNDLEMTLWYSVHKSKLAWVYLFIFSHIMPHISSWACFSLILCVLSKQVHFYINKNVINGKTVDCGENDTKKNDCCNLCTNVYQSD